MVKLVMILGLLMLAAPIMADSTDVDTSETAADSLPEINDIIVDTLPYRPGQKLAFYRPVTDTLDLERCLSQNPTAALFKSALLPGWGQVGNRRYIKALFFAGLDAWMVGGAIHYGRQAAGFYRRYESEDASTSQGLNNRNELYALYEDHKNDRNKMTWFAVIVTFVAMFDAYVDAHLSGFPVIDESDRLGVRMEQTGAGEIQAIVTLRF
ncbi:MAG: DUF5683 domain-containing protein [bacterium]